MLDQSLTHIRTLEEAVTHSTLLSQDMWSERCFDDCSELPTLKRFVEGCLTAKQPLIKTFGNHIGYFYRIPPDLSLTPHVEGSFNTRLINSLHPILFASGFLDPSDPRLPNMLPFGSRKCYAFYKKAMAESETLQDFSRSLEAFHPTLDAFASAYAKYYKGGCTPQNLWEEVFASAPMASRRVGKASIYSWIPRMSKRWVDLVDSNAFNLLGGVTVLYGSKFDDLLGCVNEADRIRTPQSFSDYVLCILFAPHHFLQLGCMGCDNGSCFAPDHENAHHCLSLAAHPNSFVCQIRPASDFADLTTLEDFDTSVFDSKHPISRGWGYWSEDALVISNHNYTRGSKDLSRATLISLMEESILSLHRSLYGPEPTAHLHDSRTSGYALSIWGVYVNYDYSRVYVPSPTPTNAMGHPSSPLFSKDTAVPHFTVSRSHLCKFTPLSDERIDDCTWDDLVGNSSCCDDCGDRFDNDDLTSVSDSNYCSNCMECFRWSEWNEEWIYEDDAVYSSLEGDYFWTHQVVEDYQGEYIRADNAVETNNGQTVHCDDDTLVRLDYGQGRLLLDDDNLVQSVIGGSLDRDHPQTVELPDGEYCHQNDIDTGRVILCEDDDGEETYKISNAKVAI